jgi:hypothetical protein
VTQQQSTATITPSELDAPPVTGVGDLVIRALGTGVCAAMLTCAGAWMLQQPVDVVGKASGVAFLVVTGGSGAWLLLSVEAWRKARNQHRLAQRKLYAAYNAIRQLEYTVADQRETISRLQSNRTAPQTPVVPANRVLRYNITDDNVECATKIINHWFTAGTWYSRRLAKEGGWSQPVHDAAIKLLKDMQMADQEPGKSPRILPRFTNHGATIAHFNKLCSDALAEPDMPSRSVVMSNAEDDD